MTIELSVRVSNAEQRYTHKFLCYEDENILLSKGDETLKKYVQEAVNNFKGDVDSVRLTFKMEW